MGGKSSAPAAPDYTAAANATAAGNQQNAVATTFANRVNQNTPYGSLNYSYTPNTSAYNMAQNAWVTGGKQGPAPDPTAYLNWTANQTLSPAQQTLLDSTNKLNTGLMNTANTGLGYANSVLAKPGVSGWDIQKPPSSFGPDVPQPTDFKAGNPTTGFNPGQSYQDAMMSRLQPQIDRENQQSDAQLANQGITQGSQAYDNAKRVLNQSHNDLLNNATVQGLSAGLQANQQAFGQNQAQYAADLGAQQAQFGQGVTGYNTGLAGNQAGFQQAAYNQMQPINVINALRTGTQVTNPNFVNPAQQQYTAGSDLMGATQATYGANLNATNASNAANSNFTNGLFSLGGAYLMSDRRLKSNIQRIGTHPIGIGIYEYDIEDRHETGVMAQELLEVKPEAVLLGDDGFYRVNYAMIGN